MMIRTGDTGMLTLRGMLMPLHGDEQPCLMQVTDPDGETALLLPVFSTREKLMACVSPGGGAPWVGRISEIGDHADFLRWFRGVRDTLLTMTPVTKLFLGVDVTRTSEGVTWRRVVVDDDADEEVIA